MKTKKTAAILFAAVMLTSCFASAAPEISEVFAAEDTYQTSSAKETVTLNSADGAAAEDIQAALVRIKANGGTVKLVGQFDIDSSIRVYSNEIIDASAATLNCNADYVLNLYQMENISIRGGKWILQNNSQLAKISTCSSCVLDSLNVRGGGNNNGCIYVYNSINMIIRNCTFQNTDSQCIYANRSNGFTVVNCKLNKADGYGIHTYFSDNVKILGNTVTAAHGDGIYVSEGKGGYVSGNVINNTTLNPLLDMDSVKKIGRSGCGIFLSKTSAINVGNAITYSGKKYEGNTVNKCENYGIHLNICDGTSVYKLKCTNSGSDCVHNSASSKTTVQNCTFKNAGDIAVAFVPGTLSSNMDDQKTCKGSLIYNNTIESTSSYGICVYSADSTTVAGNTISKTKADAIRCHASKNTKIAGNKINGTAGSDASGISVGKSSSNVNIGGKVTVNGKAYARNTIKDVKKIGITIDSSTAVITGNTIENAGNHAVRTNNSKGVKVQKNTIKNAAVHAINITKSANANISENTITSPQQDGIYVNASASAVINKNSITSCKKYGVQITNGSKSAKLTNNTIASPTKQGIVVENSTGCNVKTMTATTISAVSTTSTRASGKITKGHTAKIKIGSKYYTCTVSGTTYRSNAFPRQSKNTIVYLFDYVGSGNVIKLSTKVK